VGIQGNLQQLFDGMHTLNSEAKKDQEKTANMEVWRQKINQKMDELQTVVAISQEETKEKVKEIERKCCGKLIDHHEWLPDLKRRNESTV